MSFDFNPYKHIEIIKYTNYYGLYCHSCGGEFGTYDNDTRLHNLFLYMSEHVKSSHNRQESDFSGWSVL